MSSFSDHSGEFLRRNRQYISEYCRTNSLQYLANSYNRPTFRSYVDSSGRASTQQPCPQQRARPKASSTTTLSVRFNPSELVGKIFANVPRPIAVFSKSWCPYCKASKALLSEKGAKFYLMELDQVGTYTLQG